MNNGKFRRRPRHFHTRNVLVLVSLVLVIATAMGATLAFLITNTGDVKNAFTPSQVTSFVAEDFNDNVKSNVRIQNTGDIDAYIRAEVIVTWRAEKEENGKKVISILPYEPEENTDYTISYGTKTGQVGNVAYNDPKWILGSDGYFYYKLPVTSMAETEPLIYHAEYTGTKAPEDSGGVTYQLSIEILSSAIQSVPVNAVQSAWPAVQVVDGRLQAK